MVVSYYDNHDFVLSNIEFVVTDNAITQSNCFGFGTCLHHGHLKS